MTEKVCPKCGSINHAVPTEGARCCFDCGYEWRPCPQCGGEMGEREVWVEQDGTEYQQPDVMTCNACGIDMPLYCPRCKSELVWTVVQPDFPVAKLRGVYVTCPRRCGHEEKVGQ